MVKYIVDEYNGNLMSFNEYAQDDELDEESPSVKVGIAVLKLYCAVKTLARYTTVVNGVIQKLVNDDGLMDLLNYMS